MAEKKTAPKGDEKPRIAYETATEKHYVNGLAEYLVDGEWVADDSNVFEG